MNFIKLFPARTKGMGIRFAAILVLLLSCTELFPCTCMGPWNAKTMRDVAEAYSKQQGIVRIFTGKVAKQELQSGSLGGPTTAMSMTPAAQYRTVEFDVIRTYRGDNQSRVSVLTGLGTGDCGYDFRTGETYLVYASVGPQGLLFTSICSGTREIEDAGTAVRYLSGQKPTSSDLLSPQEYEKQYEEKVLPKRTGSICGQVLKPDGTPLKGAVIELWELREDSFPPRTADDPNTSSDTGHFCIDHAWPGRYLLTVESEDFDHNSRWMAFFPGVLTESEAQPVVIRPGVRLPDVTLPTFREKLYTIRIEVDPPNCAQLSDRYGCGVAVNSIYRNPLSYHISHLLERSGSYVFGFIPAGKYAISTYFQPDFENPQNSKDAVAKWKPTEQEVTVTGDTRVVVHLGTGQLN